MSKVRTKPTKPYKDFLLTPHASGNWCKKVNGKIYYFGHDADEALAEWLRVKDYLRAGRTPPPNNEAFEALSYCCDRFLEHKEARIAQGKITQRSFNDYLITLQKFCDCIGSSFAAKLIGPSEFARFEADCFKTMNPRTVGNHIGRLKVFFRHCVEYDLLDRMPKFGDTRQASKSELRRLKNEKAKKLFTPLEIKLLLSSASQPMKSMILLALNGGLGNADLGRMKLQHVDLPNAWIDYPRGKTNVLRQFPLWEETVCSMNMAMNCRPIPRLKSDNDLFFITKYGNSFFNADSTTNPISQEFRKLLKAVTVKNGGLEFETGEEVHLDLQTHHAVKQGTENSIYVGTANADFRPDQDIEFSMYVKGTGFYTLRHCFETYAGDSKDQVAVDYIMGHDNGAMANIYREDIDRERLVDVVNTVHRKLF